MEFEELYKQKRLAEIDRRRRQKRKQRFRRKICTIITLATICTATMGAYYTVSAKEITITEINEFEGVNTSRTVTTRANDVADALEEQGIEISNTDKLNKSADSELGDNEEIVVRRGKEIKVVTPSSEETVVVTSADTHQALEEAGYSPKEEDEINLDGANIAESETVELKAVYTEYETVEEEIPFETVYEDDPETYVGEETVSVEGSAGIKAITYKVNRYEDGTEKSRTVESETVTAEPVNKVIKKGTKEKPVPTAAPTASAKASSATPAPTSAVESGGTINGYKYSKKITMSGTAYTNSPSENAGYSVTAMGTQLRYGVAAVDPSVIPLGSKLFVVSADGQYVYGVAMAEDTGGAIKGNKIDLCFTSMGEAAKFGRRDCIVYVLE